MRLKIPYTVILVLLGVGTTVTLTVLSLNGGPMQEPALAFISQIQKHMAEPDITLATELNQSSNQSKPPLQKQTS